MLGAIKNQEFPGNATIVTMKLHLPHALRTVLLAIMAAPAAITLTSGSLLGLATAAMIAGQQAEANNITFEGGTLENFTYGSHIKDDTTGDTTFAQGDTITFTGDTVLTLGDDITSGGMRVQKGAQLTLTGNGHTLTTPIALSSNGVLTLNDQALATDTTVSGKDGVLRINWGDTAASLANQLAEFKGTLLINNSTYRLENGESYGQLFLNGSSTLNAGALTYSGGLFSSENSIINSTGATTFSGGVYGFGALTKTGAGTLSFIQTNSYHTGDLVIENGIVRFGSATDNNVSQNARNSLLFNSITINDGTTFDDSHAGMGADFTTIILNGGTLRAYDMQLIAQNTLGLYGTTVNQYQALEVNAGGTISHSFKGEHRFGVLTSTEGSNPTLTITFGGQPCVVRFDQVNNYNGTITASGGADATRRLIIGDVLLDAGHTFTVNGVTTNATNITKKGAGDMRLNGGLAVNNTLSITEGSVTISASLQAERITLSGGSLTTNVNTETRADTLHLTGGSMNAGGNITLRHELDISTGRLTLSSANAGLTTDKLSLRSGASLSLSGANATVSADELSIQSGASLSMTGTGSRLNVGMFNLGDGSLTTERLHVSTQLTMNYRGSLNVTNSLTVEDGIVLSYSGSGDQRLHLGKEGNTERTHIFIDASSLTDQQLKEGVDLGIDSFLLDAVRINGLEGYNLTKQGDYLFLQGGRRTGSPWDRSWGSTVLATAPKASTVPDVTWSPDGFEPGLFHGGQFNIDNYYTAANLTGAGECSIVGGAWGTSDQHPGGGTIERQVWITAASGNLTLIAGGSLNDPTSSSVWNQNGDTHIQVQAGATVGTVIGGHMKDNGSPTMTGDSYITIQGGDLTGSVFGSGVHVGYDRTYTGQAVNISQTLTQTGNTHLYLHAPLTQNISTIFKDPTITHSDPLQQTIDAYVIAGGSLSYYAGQTSVLNGNSTITVDFDSPTKSATMVKDIIGGHVGPGNRTQSGDASIIIRNTGRTTFSGTIIGGHGGAGRATSNGDTSISMSNLGSSTFGGAIVGGSNGTNITQTGNTAISITGSSRATFSKEVIGAHSNIGGTASSLHGNSYLTIDGGQFDEKVIGGNYTDAGGASFTISGSTNLSISEGSFSKSVIGGSYGGATEQLGGVNIKLTGGSYHGDTSIIGGSSVTGGVVGIGIGDIDIELSGVTVAGDILGGSQIEGDNNPNNPLVRQGAISLKLISGTYQGNIYAAGEQVQGHRTTILTTSTNVSISRNATFNSRKGVTISGGYKGGDSYVGSVVSGNRILTFADEGHYDNLADVSFRQFNVVDVVQSNGVVALNQNLNQLDANIVKTGQGTLQLSSQNSVSHVTVLEGTLKLNGASSRTSSLDLLTISQGGTLDISASLCGINGQVMLEGGSTLVVHSGQKAAVLAKNANTGGLVWGDTADAKVNLHLADLTLPDEEGYEIELFSGLTRGDITGLNMREISNVGYATEASPYLETDSPVSLAHAYLLLKEDGTLVLTNILQKSIYWEGPNDGVWNQQAWNWATQDEAVPDSQFNDTFATVFSNDEEMTIRVEEDVITSRMEAIDGNYTFEGDNSITISQGLSVYSKKEGSSASVHFNNEVVFNPHAGLLVDEGCQAEFNNDIAIYQLTNAGIVTVNGDLSIQTGASRGGDVTANDVQLGGSSVFTQLTARDVTGNAGHTLTLGGASEIRSLDGGTLVVQKDGSAHITTAGVTKLTALGGAGSLMTGGALTLQEAGSIGNLTTTALTVGDALDVNSTLTADTIAFSRLPLPSTDNVVVDAGTLAGNTGDTVNVQVEENMVSKLILANGRNYYLVQYDEGDPEQVLLNGGTDEMHVENRRYAYDVKRVEDGVVIQSEVLFSYKMVTPNGKAGGSLLNHLFDDGALLNKYPDGDLNKVIHAMDDLVINYQDQAADTLAAAVAGSSIPALGMAMVGDIQRQLHVIRNRTTTMGVDECLYNEDMPYFNAWINAEGNHHQLEDDGTASGYKLDSWGGTVGFDVDATPNLTFGLALTALHGDYSAEAPDSADGDLDTQYLTAFARYAAKSWVHTFVASLGRADISLERTVSHAYGSYTTKGDTTGIGFGLMYEVGKVFAVNEDASACIQPVLNFTLAHSSISGYTETGSDAALETGDIDATTFTVGAGVRMQATGGETVYNRTSIWEARALVKVNAGDRQAENDVAFAGMPNYTTTVESAEIGAVGVELGAGLTIPVGAESGAFFADVSAELRSGYTSVNGTVGYRFNF